VKTNHLQMLRDVEEIHHLFSETRNIDGFLTRIVEMVASHLHTVVCSIYLYDEEKQTLSIKANTGLNQETYRAVSLKLGEGLVGTSLKELRPMCIKRASQSPEFKFFPGLNEEQFDSFLAVPIRLGTTRIGVLVVQRDKNHPFNDTDTVTLQVIASQLASIISQIRMLLSIGIKHQEKLPEVFEEGICLIKGKGASSGYAYAPSSRYISEKPLSHFSKITYEKSYTLDDFYKAVEQTRRQLEDLQQKVEEKLSDVASLIFTAHLLILKDKSFIGAMAELIRAGTPAPTAILEISKKYIDAFAASQNQIIKEKKQDIEDLLFRLMNNLLSQDSDQPLTSGHIVIARELYPSDLLTMSSENVAGIILISGGVTSHISVLARSLQIPLVIADDQKFLQIPNNTPIILDATHGNIYLNPTDSIIHEFETNKNTAAALQHNKELMDKETHTTDGLRITLLANINLLSDIALARASNSDGVGLYRTEFPFLIRTDFPTEEEQFIIYQKIVKGMAGKPVTFRTLDIGGDKLLTYYEMKEQNPSLGFRSIRFSLKHKDVFVQQIRAILRAGHDADLRIMFPMISSIDEFMLAKEILAEAIGDLQKKNIKHNNTPQIGIMVEIPSIIPLLDEIAQEADFFSIGTNDLIQFFLAVDRTNEKVASFYTPAHPAILRSLKIIADIGIKNKKPVSVCGDMAHDIRFIPFLIGIGIHTLSIDPFYIPRIKQAILALDSTEAKEMAHTVLAMAKIADIEAFLNSR
jgi:phosphotransferase system, enzyme I, PtsP